MKTGKVSESVLKRSILRQLKTKRKEIICGAGVGYDCAIFASVQGKIWNSCVQEAAVSLQPGKTAACVSLTQVLQRCANNLAAGGAEPVAVMLTLLLPETTEEADIKGFMAEAESTCQRLNMQIVGGQTNINAALQLPFAVVTGYGTLSREQADLQNTAEAGQDIVVSKWIGMEGTAVAAGVYREKLLARYPAYLVDEAEGFDKYLSILPEAAIAVREGVSLMHDASQGGIFAALWELAERAGTGLSIDMKKLPIRQETVEVCECCGLNPYELRSGGSLVMSTKDGMGLVLALQEAGIAAAVVGKLTADNSRILRNEEEIRYMDRPRTDEIYKMM